MKKAIKSYCLLLAGLTLLWASCKKEVDTIPLPEERGWITGQAYGEDPRQTLDVLLPENRNANTPVVFIFHGGMWTTGNKGLGYVRTLASAMADTGIAAVTMNYRLASGNFQDQMDDLRDGLGFVQQNAEAWGISSNRIGYLGFEAGGHLALLYAHSFQDERVKAVATLATPVDFTDSYLRQVLDTNGFGDDLEAFIGGPWETDSVLYWAASPIYFLSNVPTLLFHGFNDEYIPAYQAVWFKNALTGLGGVSDTTILYDKGHNLFGGSDSYDLMIWESKAFMSYFLRN